MNSSIQGSIQGHEKTDINGSGNIIGHHNQAVVVPVTVNVNVHAFGILTQHEHDLLTRYRAATDDGRRAIERAFHRASRLLTAANQPRGKS